VQFNCTIDPAQHLLQNYIWDFGNNLVPQDTFIAQSTYVNPGTYHVSLTVTDLSGCSNTLTLSDFITVFEDPEVHFTTSPITPTMLNPTLDFNDASYPNIVGWEWLFDTLGNSNYENPSFTFPGDSGTYYVTLIVEDGNTCKDTLTKKIFIRSEIALFLPNSFTPNGDGINDSFTPKGFGISEQAYAFLIFNRWGELVFETNNVLEGWDGTFKDELLPSGVYAWRADFRDLNGKDYRRTGQMNILP
jgi:gliding motility-associated-like protein